jgi:hypothetical protein
MIGFKKDKGTRALWNLGSIMLMLYRISGKGCLQYGRGICKEVKSNKRNGLAYSASSGESA